MAGDEQQRSYWFPYWSGPPLQPPSSRPQTSRRPSATSQVPLPPFQHRQPSRGRAAASPPSPSPAQARRPSPSRASPLIPIRVLPPPTSTSNSNTGAAPPSSAQAPRPSPSRASPPLTTIRVPPPPTSNSNIGAAAPPKPISGPVAAREAAPKLKDVDVVVPPPPPQEKKSVVRQQPSTDIKPAQDKAMDHEEHKAPPVDKPEIKIKEKVKEIKEEIKIKEKEMEKDEIKSKEKEMKDEIKNNEKEKKKEDKEKKHKDKIKEKETKEEIKSKEKTKEMEKDEIKSKDKEKEKKHKEDSPSPGKKTTTVEQGKLHTEIKSGVADMVHKASSGATAGSSSSSVITLAGENKGASMKVGGKDNGAPHWHGHGRRLDGNDDHRAASAGEGKMRAVVNSNVQVINNSLMFQSSCSNGDPGVHLKLSTKSKSKDKPATPGVKK